MTQVAGHAGRSSIPTEERNALRLLIERPGLVSRFGRVVPDSNALLGWLAALEERARGQGKRLSIVLFDDARSEIHRLDSGRAMALCGTEAARDALLREQIPAYQLTDRRERDHLRLPVFEVERVVSEALRMAVPRPMSDASRQGRLIIVPLGGLDRLRAVEAQLLARDPRADWVLCGEDLLAYSESADAAETLAVGGARILPAPVNLADIEIGPSVVRVGSQRLIEHSGAPAPDQGEQGFLPWQQCRRSALWQWGEGGVPTSPTEVLCFYERPELEVFGIPYSSQSQGIVVIRAKAAGTTASDLFAVSESLRAAGIGAALLWIDGDDSTAALRRFLWDREINNLAVLVQAGENPEGQVHPWTRLVSLPSQQVSPASIASRVIEAYTA